MKNALLMAAVFMISGSAFAFESSSSAAACAQGSQKKTAFEQMIQRPSPSDCYFECQPERGGDGDYSRCYNECMRRR